MPQEIKEKIIEILKRQCREDDAYIKVDKPTDLILAEIKKEKKKWLKETNKMEAGMIKNVYQQGYDKGWSDLFHGKKTGKF